VKNFILQIFIIVKDLIRKILLEFKLDKNNYYEYIGGNLIYRFEDVSGNKNILQLIEIEGNGVHIKFSVSNFKTNINSGSQTRLKDEKVFNTYLKIIFDKIIPSNKYDYIEYKPMNEDGSYDNRRARLYQIGVNKYIPKGWALAQEGELWKLMKERK
jgi:hypothetical protein